MIRTSNSHPIRIAELTCGTGMLGLTFCPGKVGGSAFGDSWKRDLQLDLSVIGLWRPDLVVTLMEAHELAHLGVPDLGAAVRQRA
ncbi:hypothetical protein BH11PSE2_BH11PSE2_14900 [soil metagenome]